MGAEPDYVGLVISRNFERLVRLRRKRQQSMASFIGIIYGLTASFAFALAASFQVAYSINTLFGQLNVPTEYIGDIIHVIPPSGMTFVMYVMLTIMIVHSLLSAVSIKVADGGHVYVAMKYFVILLWIFAAGMYAGQVLMEKMMNLGSGSTQVLAVLFQSL
ncbi:hypothetical protein A3K92_02695 [Thermococcus gorgonarius]|uniref:Uncharacterized protein n=1 Tax=Thermococcus gorgonarius TaxID=71997 RepID=A0A2Z2M7R5_THEGO|nr:hypothetical protein A3K92_02695 [Thermococcus gorgonarius]